MKIGKYTKLKDNRYSVKIGDTLVKLYDDVIVKFELLRKKEIDETLFEEMMTYNDSLEAYYKGLKYITRKLRTEKEVFVYLSKEYKKSVVNQSIERLRKDGYLNEEIYLKAYVMDQVHLSSSGPNKIKKDLIKLGIAEDKIQEELNKIDDEIWLEKLEKLVGKAIVSNKRYGENKLKEKLIYDLGNKGYYKWMIEEAFDKNCFQDNGEILKKEFNKVVTKLTKKYEGYELESKVIAKLLSKGFCYDDIKKVLSDFR